MDYLPDGNRNFVFARIIVPPGYNKEATLDIAKAMEKSAQPLWEKKIDVEGEKPKTLLKQLQGSQQLQVR